MYTNICKLEMDRSKNFTGFSTHRKTTSSGDDLTGREPHKEDEYTGSQFLRKEKTISEREKIARLCPAAVFS